MRDPEGYLRFEPEHVIRRLYGPLASDHFLYRPVAQRLVHEERLIPFQFEDAQTLRAPRVPFVSHPYEWTDAQFYDAATLTLDISETLLDEGLQLKDASAWNVVYHGTRPMFCDHLSVEPIGDRRWWAFAQFVRHFVLPLCVSRFRGLHAKDCFKIARDGLTPAQARDLMGLKRYFTRYWPLMIEGKGRASVTAATLQRADQAASSLRNIYASARMFLNGVVPSSGAKKSVWIDYVHDRTHYSADAANVKRETVARWLAEIRPTWVVDFGCNTGEFSLIARENGAAVIAIDLDHESVQELYRRRSGDVGLYPLCATLDDFAGGRGWAGAEFPGLMHRLEGRGDVVLMLALIHHLSISDAVRYADIVEFAARVTRRYLIAELLEENDPLVERLCAQRRRSPAEFGLQKQREAFARRFAQRAEVVLPGGTRRLLLLELVPNC